MPPPPSGRSGIGGGRSEGDCSASGRDCSPQTGPLGLGSLHGRSRLEYRGRSSHAPSGAAEDDRDSISGSVNLDWDDSFWTVLHLMWEFHSMEEPASVAPNRCNTSLAPIYGLQSESLPFLHLPLSPLLWSLPEGLSLRTRIWLCPSSWKTRPSTGFFLFPVAAIGGIIGLPPPLFLARILSRPVWPLPPWTR